jgi:hypothetical protein
LNNKKVKEQKTVKGQEMEINGYFADHNGGQVEKPLRGKKLGKAGKSPWRGTRAG